MNQGNNGRAAGNPLEQVRTLYTELAIHPEKDFGWGKGKENARALGYAGEWLRGLPDIVWESAAPVGNPFSLGPIHPGETVIDIGCGAGADACIAALLVGTEGKVSGIDCTSAMIAKAGDNADVSGLPQVEFHEAEMSDLPLPDCTADVLISNGAINLATDKEAVLAEAYRVLRPGGRLQIADMVRDTSTKEPPCCSSKASWADCVSGTLEPETFLAMLTRAGFANVELAGFTDYRTAANTRGALFRAIRPVPLRE
ncbi:MAG: methyltransferase domain-containing protein [Gammaproteobacteria bacterium]|jgi:ubiquinone/menaquinone biosynthesis C-methylase UbiE